MKKLSKRQKLIILIAIITLIVIIGIIIGAGIIKTNIANDNYNSSNGSSNSGNLLPQYIRKGITLGGVTGTLEDLDTSDATAKPEDIALGKTAYVNGVKITGTYEEKQEGPTITSLTATETTISIVATGGSSNITGYAYSTVNNVPYYFHTVTGTMNFTYTLDSLASGTTYYIWVQDENGLVSETRSIRTDDEIFIPDLNNSNTTFSQDIYEWTNQDVTVSVRTTISGYTLQLATGDPNVESNWHDATSQKMTANGTVYARLSDGTRSGGWTSNEVTNIDKTPPFANGRGTMTISRLENQGVFIVNNIRDNESGVAKLVFYYKSDAQNSFSRSEDITFTTNGGGYLYRATFNESDFVGHTIYMYVEIYDVAGNVSKSYIASMTADGKSSYDPQ